MSLFSSKQLNIVIILFCLLTIIFQTSFRAYAEENELPNIYSPIVRMPEPYKNPPYWLENKENKHDLAKDDLEIINVE